MPDMTYQLFFIYDSFPMLESINIGMSQ